MCKSLGSLVQLCQCEWVASESGSKMFEYDLSLSVCLQAQEMIQELFGRIRNIKEKAEHSEHMVCVGGCVCVCGEGRSPSVD